MTQVNHQQQQQQDQKPAGASSKAWVGEAMERGQVFTLDVQRDGDDHRMLWHFDSIEQVRLALGHCEQYRADVAFVGAVGVVRGDFITDAEEFRVWLAFEYITEAEECAKAETGYVCKACGGVAPVGVGYAVHGWRGVADESRTSCSCGYSVRAEA